MEIILKDFPAKREYNLSYLLSAKPKVKIGRQKICDIVLGIQPDGKRITNQELIYSLMSASREHGIFVINNGKLLYESENYTKIFKKDARLFVTPENSPVEINYGDKLFFGRLEYGFIEISLVIQPSAR